MRGLVLALAAVVGGVALATPLSLTWEGKLSWKLPGATVTWRSDLALGWELPSWEWKAESSMADGAWTKLLFSGSGKLGVIELAPSLEFDPQAPAFKGGKLSWVFPWVGIKFEGVAKLEANGVGWGLSLRGPPGSLIELARLRFNLKRQLDEVLNPTFAPSFAFGEARFAIPLSCCLSPIRGRVSFTKAGFEEVGVSFPLPWKLDCGITFGASLRFRTGEARVSLFPGLVYQGPAGVDVLLGLDWDAATSTLRGIRVYGFGFHGEVGNLRFRSLTGLAEDQVDLVKDPYWEFLELIWKVPGCCGDGEVGFIFYFGDAGLLGLGEVEAKGRIPLSDRFQLVVALSAAHSGDLTLGFGWKASL